MSTHGSSRVMIFDSKATPVVLSGMIRVFDKEAFPLSPVGIGVRCNDEHLLGDNCKGHPSGEGFRHPRSRLFLIFGRQLQDKLHTMPFDVVQVLLITVMKHNAIPGDQSDVDSCCFEPAEKSRWNRWAYSK